MSLGSAEVLPGNTDMIFIPVDKIIDGEGV